MLASTRTVTPSTVNGGASASWIALGRRPRPPPASTSSRKTANSSPPSRASRSSVAVQASAQPARRRQQQQVVAGVVPEAVVDLLEPVQVQQQQRAARAVVGEPAAALRLLVEGPPVAQPGQLVGQGQLVAVRRACVTSRKVTISRPRAARRSRRTARRPAGEHVARGRRRAATTRAQGGADRDAEQHPVGQQDPGRPARTSRARSRSAGWRATQTASLSPPGW